MNNTLKLQDALKIHATASHTNQIKWTVVLPAPHAVPQSASQDCHCGSCSALNPILVAVVS